MPIGPEEHARRTAAGIAKAKAMGRMPGRPPRNAHSDVLAVVDLPTMEAARAVGLCKSAYLEARKRALAWQDEQGKD